MSRKAYAAPNATRSLNIGLWHELGKSGSPVPVTITLAGDSMRPLIRRGRDRVTIVPMEGKLRIGDVVLFRGGPERYVVHRVWKMRDGMVQTFGDNCYYPDAWIPVSEVWGRVIRFERFGRSWRLDTALSRGWGRLWMAAYPARRAYMKGRALAARCYRKIFPKKK